jgi:ribosome-binding factor A
MTAGDGRRPRRVSEAIREYVAAALVQDLSDPRFSNLSITRVEVPPDLSVAWIYLRAFVEPKTERERQRLIASVGRAQGRLRRGLAPRLGMKRVPELRFQYDEGPDAQKRVEDLLDEIREQGEGSD